MPPLFFSYTVFIFVYCMSSFDTLPEGPDIHADGPQLTSARLSASKRPWVERLPANVALQRRAPVSLNPRLTFAGSLEELKGGKDEERDSGWSSARGSGAGFVRRSDPAS